VVEKQKEEAVPFVKKSMTDQVHSKQHNTHRQVLQQ